MRKTAVDVKNVKPEWLMYQLDAGRDIKHIADYLGSSRREVTELMRSYGIMEDKPAPAHRKKTCVVIPFEEVRVNDVVVKNGISCSVVEKTARTMTVRFHTRAGGERRLTKKKWLDERWKVRIENEYVVHYNLSDVTNGKELLAGVSGNDDPSETFGRSFENAMRGLVRNENLNR